MMIMAMNASIINRMEVRCDTLLCALLKDSVWLILTSVTSS